ncbi:MAG: VOC family protein [Sphingobium sp.]
MARLNYVEFPASDKAASKAFFERAFGWTLSDFGPDYAATVTDDVDIGLDGSGSPVSAALAVIEVEDIDAALIAVEAAGGVVTRPIFPFPGGRRFHVREPSGNELGVWQRGEH